jgi:dihydroflavonol-4-reductase
VTETILVTGACGFTGSNMLEYLAENRPAANIVATDLPGSKRSEYYVEAPNSDDPQPVYYDDILDELAVEFIPADLTDEADVDRLGAAHEYDTVYHIASLFDYFAPREALYEVNVEGTRNLLRVLAAQDTRPRLVHWSTLGVLGDAGFDEPKTETDGYHPHNRYCESKVAQEQVVKAYQDRIDCTIIRPAPIYGPRHQYGVFHILTLLERFKVVPIFSLYPRSRQLQFPCVHVHDLVRAATSLAENPDAIGESYHVVSDPIGQDELLRFLAAELCLRSITIPTPYYLYAVIARLIYPVSLKSEELARRRDTRPLVDAPMLRYLTANMWFSNEKLKATGFEFAYEDPRDGLREYIAWCREEGYLDPRIEWVSRARNIGQSRPAQTVSDAVATVRHKLSRS